MGRGTMEGADFGVVIARVIAALTVLSEGILLHWVNVSVVGGNVASVSLLPLGEAFCQAWADFAVSFAWAMDQMLLTLWSVV